MTGSKVIKQRKNSKSPCLLQELWDEFYKSDLFVEATTNNDTIKPSLTIEFIDKMDYIYTHLIFADNDQTYISKKTLESFLSFSSGLLLNYIKQTLKPNYFNDPIRWKPTLEYYGERINAFFSFSRDQLPEKVILADPGQIYRLSIGMLSCLVTLKDIIPTIKIDNPFDPNEVKEDDNRKLIEDYRKRIEEDKLRKNRRYKALIDFTYRFDEYLTKANFSKVEKAKVIYWITGGSGEEGYKLICTQEIRELEALSLTDEYQSLKNMFNKIK